MKGGGGGLVPGANDIEEGVTIDLLQLSAIALSSDKKTVSVQAGVQWGRLYTFLDAKGYTVPGARVTNVGVAGLTLGGGLNNYMSRYGWTFDLVKDFEIVLGNGTLTNASPNKNADLYKALKGGGQGNFGIVTRIDFTTLETGLLWGGLTTYDFKNVGKLYRPVVETINQSAKEPDASFVLSWTNNATTGTTTANTYLQYTGNATEKKYFVHTEEPTTKSRFPEALSAFTFDKVGTPTSNTLRIDSTYNFVKELNAADSQRFLIGNIFFKADAEILANVDRISQKILSPYINKTKAYPYNNVQIEYLPLPRVINEISEKKNGGNVLGLERIQSNAIQLLVLFDWSDPTQDNIIQNLTTTILTQVTKYTKSVPGASIDFQYVGLAYEFQDPIGSYGQRNVDYLKQISKKYDPAQVFQKLVPGGFKLDDAGSKDKKFYKFNQFSSTGTN